MPKFGNVRRNKVSRGLAARETRNEYSSQGDCPVGQVWQPAVGREQLEARVQLERFVLERPCDVAVRLHP